MNKIVIDARTVGPIPHGFSRYITRLAEGLAALSHEGSALPYEVIFLVGSQFRDIQHHPIRAFNTVEVGAPFLNPVEIFEIPVVLKKLGASLYHSPTFSSLYRSPCPWVVTVHDLNHRIYGNRMQKLYYEHLLKPFFMKAKARITVSEFSRRELLQWTGLSPDSIDIVYNSMGSNDSIPDSIPMTRDEIAPILQRYGLQEGHFFLCLSNPKPHKNVGLLVEAYRSYSKTVPQEKVMPLVLSMKEFGDVPGVKSVGGILDSDVRAFISASRAVVFPSLYEGFGLPPVEAASLGASVIVSRIDPHLEGLVDLRADEVRWVAPQDLNEWVKALQQAADGSLNRVSHESRSRLMARFDVKRMGQDMDRIYRRVLNLNS